MESPSRALTTLSPPPPPPPHNPQLSSSASRRRRAGSESAANNSPEFEFWNIGRNNPELTNTPLHSADELFSDGFLLPLRFLPSSRTESECCDEPGLDREAESEPGPSLGSTEPSALITSEVSSNGNGILSASKRWKEIFKRSEKKPAAIDEIKPEKPDKRRGKDRKNSSSNNNNSGSTSAELNININIWPFSRSRSAGNNSNRSSKPASANRKVSSAPCSRSNSSGESKTSRRSWPSSPGRPGVHLGRASPVWQAKRAVPGGNRASAGGGAGKGKVLKLNVPVCIGYRQHLSCRSDVNGAVVGGGGSGGDGVKSGGGNSGGNGNLFGFRGLFSKKSSGTILTV